MPTLFAEESTNKVLVSNVAFPLTVRLDSVPTLVTLLDVVNKLLRATVLFLTSKLVPLPTNSTSLVLLLAATPLPNKNGLSTTNEVPFHTKLATSPSTSNTILDCAVESPVSTIILASPVEL